jgi:hypothetical protein
VGYLLYKVIEAILFPNQATPLFWEMRYPNG